MANRTTDEIIESLLVDEGVLHRPAEPQAEGDAVATTRREAVRPRGDRSALADALRAVLDFDD